MTDTVVSRIRATFAGLSKRMQQVGAYVLEHPADVALLSMREQARRAGVQPATMTRFAQRLGYSGYDEMREFFVATVRGRASDFGARADELAARRLAVGAPTLAHDLALALVDRVSAIVDAERLDAINAAAAILAEANRIFCLGHRSSFAPAFHFAYVAGLYGAPTRLLDAPGGLDADALCEAMPSDVLMAVSFAPYTRATLDIARFASEAGVRVVAITDHAGSPLARFADRTITAPTELPGATHVASLLFAVAEMLAALVVSRIGTAGRATLDRNEAEFARRRVYWTDDGGLAA